MDGRDKKEKSKLDLMLVNARVYTLAEEGGRAEAVGIRQGRIEFVGSNEEAAAHDADTVLDLKGKTVVPGLGDSHLHLYAYCQNRASVTLEAVRSIDELISVMKKKAASVEKGEWIKGTDFDHTKFRETRMPDRWDLDRISRSHPIVIRRCCLHVMVANSAAIERAQITEKELQELEGLIELDEKGIPNGVFYEKAASVFDRIVPDPLADPKKKKQALKEALQDMAARGITAAHTYAAKIWNYNEEIDTYKELEREGELPVRIVVSLDELFEPEERQSVKDPFRKVKYGSCKLFTDGSLGARSAALTEAYSDDPMNYGACVDKDVLIGKLRAACESGLQPAIHAIGDKALDIALDALEAMDFRRANLPVRLIHAQVVRPDQLERLERLPVVIDIQPAFLCTDLYWIEKRLGKGRLKYAYLWKTLTDSGLILAGGSDCPVESYDPVRGIFAAVMRQDTNGFPPEGWKSGERLSVYEAFCLFSKNIAYTTGDEDVLGTVETGKFADLTVFEEDPFQIRQENLKDLRVAMTFVAGEMVYNRGSGSDLFSLDSK